MAAGAAERGMKGDFLDRMEDHVRQWSTPVIDPYEALNVEPPRFKSKAPTRLTNKENAGANSPTRASIELVPEHLELFSPANPLLTHDSSPLSPLGAGARHGRSVSRWTALESMEMEIVKEEGRATAQVVPLKGHGSAVVQLPLRKNKQGKTMYPAVRESFMLDVSASDSVEDLSALLRAPAEEETAAERYQSQCKRNNIAPLNSVCKLLAIGSTKLRIAENRISPGHGLSLAKALGGMTTLTVIDFSGNQLGDRVVMALCEAVAGADGSAGCPALRCVKLDGNSLKGGCMQAVGAMVQAAQSLEYLSLSENPQLGNAVKPLFTALAADPSLATLNLVNAGVEDSAGHVLGDALSTNLHLAHLLLAYNKIIHAWPSIARGMCVNRTLQTLDVGHNGAASTVGMADMLLRNESLTTMDFAGCRFEEPAVNKLASVLPATSSLQVITVNPSVAAALMRKLAAAGECQISLKGTGTPWDAEHEQAFELTFLGDPGVAKQAAFPGAVVKPKAKATEGANGGFVDPTKGLTSLESAAALRERHLESTHGRMEDTGVASSWEDEVIESVSALAEGLWCKDDPSTMFVHRRVAGAVHAALQRRRTHLHVVWQRADRAHARFPANTSFIAKRDAAQTELNAFGASAERILRRMGMVGSGGDGGGAVDGDFSAKSTALLVGAPEGTVLRTITLRVVGLDAIKMELLEPKLERILRRVYDLVPSRGLTMAEMREALRAHHPTLRAVFFHYSKLFSLGEVHDAKIPSSAPRGRGGGPLGGASAAETLSGRQLWRMLHNCGVLSKVVTVAHADRLAAVARRPQDDHYEGEGMSDAHRPQILLNEWEFCELIVRLAAVKMPKERAFLAAFIHKFVDGKYTCDARDDATRQLHAAECQRVFWTWNDKLLKIWKFFAHDVEDVSALVGKGMGKGKGVGSYRVLQMDATARLPSAKKETKLAAPFEPHTETAVRPASVQSTYRTAGPFGTSEGRSGSSTSSARAASARGSLATVTAASKLVGTLARIRSASARPSGTGAHRGQPKAAAAAKEPEPDKPTNAVLAPDSAPDADVGDGMGCTLPFNRTLVMLEVLRLLGPQLNPKMVAHLTELVTARPKLVPMCNILNRNASLVFHEFLELLGRMAPLLHPPSDPKAKLPPLADTLEAFLMDTFIPAAARVIPTRL